ncbi:histidine kinase [Microbacterium sp. p3-SID338]|uniref:sensor histidine kinase n=1 Tax=unclassified Microbacterium TaxID=2609290 RepID=UPI002155298B|nr:MULTISPECIES: histidine kinase [unclassified Microbacterium]MCT1394697.1 histidine kinase [Microbacterium sp. p3-SID338]
MTTQTATPGAAATGKPPLRIPLTILHLAGVGVIGGGIFGMLGGLLGTGLGLLFVFGVGIVVLVGLVYALFGVGWFEIARVAGLYRVPNTPLRLQPRDRPGFGGWLRSLGRQAIDGRMWRAVANFAITAVLGFVVLRLFWAFLWSIIIAFAPLTSAETIIGPFGGGQIPVSWAPLIGILGALASAAGIIGLALLARTLALAIVARAREVELTERVRASTAQREGAVRAADLERTRIERDLHDGVQPRLVSVGMTLGLAQQKIDTDPDAAKELISEAHTSTKAAITELRQLARGIHASVLDDRGLDAALSALASRSPIPVQLDVRMDPSTSSGTQGYGSGIQGGGSGIQGGGSGIQGGGSGTQGGGSVIQGGGAGASRPGRDAEAAVYFSIAESLTNAAKHSRASEARVTVRLREGNTLWARVEDNGMGGAQVIPGGGLDGIANRILAAGGTFRLDSPQGGPTSLEVNVPCAS